MTKVEVIRLSDYVKLPISDDPSSPAVMINPGTMGVDVANRLADRFTADQLQHAVLDVTDFRDGWLISSFFRRFFKAISLRMPRLDVQRLDWLTKHSFQQENISLWDKCNEVIHVGLSLHDAPVVIHALCKRLKEVSQELAILRLTKDRDLTREERWQLPANLQQFSREELQEQIDPWISLEDTTFDLIQRYVEAEQGTKSGTE